MLDVVLAHVSGETTLVWKVEMSAVDFGYVICFAKRNDRQVSIILFDWGKARLRCDYPVVDSAFSADSRWLSHAALLMLEQLLRQAERILVPSNRTKQSTYRLVAVADTVQITGLSFHIHLLPTCSALHFVYHSCVLPLLREV